MIQNIKEKIMEQWNKLKRNTKIFICAAAVILAIALIQGALN
tara:strand:- start:527 stop:652 length:126 start_codon:yes stop_codon:yes gene_type:complete